MWPPIQDEKTNPIEWNRCATLCLKDVWPSQRFGIVLNKAVDLFLRNLLVDIFIRGMFAANVRLIHILTRHEATRDTATLERPKCNECTSTCEKLPHREQDQYQNYRVPSSKSSASCNPIRFHIQCSCYKEIIRLSHGSSANYVARLPAIYYHASHCKSPL